MSHAWLRLGAVHDCRWKLLRARPRVASPTGCGRLGGISCSKSSWHHLCPAWSLLLGVPLWPLVAYPDSAATAAAAALPAWVPTHLCRPFVVLAKGSPFSSGISDMGEFAVSAHRVFQGNVASTGRGRHFSSLSDIQQPWVHKSYVSY